MYKNLFTELSSIDAWLIGKYLFVQLELPVQVKCLVTQCLVQLQSLQFNVSLLFWKIRQDKPLLLPFLYLSSHR